MIGIPRGEGGCLGAVSDGSCGSRPTKDLEEDEGAIDEIGWEELWYGGKAGWECGERVRGIESGKWVGGNGGC